MHKIPFSPPDITEAEIQEVCEALRSGWITTGPKTKEFERQIAAYCGTDKAVCLNSATACLEMTLRILGIGPGDEVITSASLYLHRFRQPRVPCGSQAGAGGHFAGVL